MRLEQLVEETSESMPLRTIFDRFVSVAEYLGFPWVAYGSLSHHNYVTVDTPEYPAIMLNYPREWRSRYFRRGYVNLDPVLTQCRQSAKAFGWRQLARVAELDAKRRRVFSEAADFGLSDGVTVPLHGPNGELAVVSFATAENESLGEDRISRAEIAARHFHSLAQRSAMYQRARRAGVMLSDRERECLCWSARGKSSWETGLILGISEHTVNFHVKSAMKKFKTSNRIVAVVEAMRSGDILP